MTTLRCSHCGLALEPGLDRCPQCLRRHTAELAAPKAAPFDAVRWVFLLVAWLLAAPVGWLHFTNSAWLGAHQLELSGTLLVAALVLLPPRFAFSSVLERAGWGEAAGALGMVWGFAALLAGSVAIASRLTSSVPVAVMSGLLIFLGPMVVVPPLFEAHRAGQSRRKALGVGLLRFAGVAAAVITLFGVKVLFAPKPKPPLVLVDNPRALLDPLDLEHAPVERAWRAGPDGLTALHLASEAEPFERSLLRLKLELLEALPELDQTPDVSPVVTLWVPARFASAGARALIEKEASLLNELFTKSKRRTKRGEALRVVIAFGAPPP
ncbi:MAG: hypothetical protein Q8L48_40310 [Archangium sp.]|nr:hypothetical protein [Archangium sp.]